MVIKSKELKTVIETSLDDSKAQEIVSIDLAGKTEIADYMIIASGTSNRHVNAIADNLIKTLKTSGVKGIEPEGTETGEWIVIDALDIIIHIFKPDARTKYDLEGMWQIPAGKTKSA